MSDPLSPNALKIVVHLRELRGQSYARYLGARLGMTRAEIEAAVAELAARDLLGHEDDDDAWDDWEHYLADDQT